MASLGTYKITASNLIPSQSGNGIVALYNKVGSGKKVYIKNVEIQNLRRDSIGANTRVTDYELLRISAQTSGTEITPIKLDSNASAIPSQIKCYLDGNPTISTTSVAISATTTLAFAVGPPGTITRGGGSWITDGIIQGADVTITGSASNNRTYRVRSTTATVITVETQQVVATEGAVAATATATIPTSLGRFCLRHQFLATTTQGFMNNFNLGVKGLTFGNVYNALGNYGGTIEPIWLAEGEGLTIRMRKSLDLDAATDVKEFHTFALDVLFSLDWGGGDKTYKVTTYVTPNGEEASLFSIMNNTGSGRNIKILSVDVAEIGDISTPYFMVVPFDYMDTAIVNDTVRDLTYIELDSSSPSITSYVNLKKDVPLFPKGFATGNPLFPMQFGSAVPANGLNYLITKDFQGPIFAAFFAEKTELPNNPTTAITNTMVSFSHKYSTIFKSNDMYLAEGEGLAIVAASESLGGIAAGTANQVNKYSMGNYGFNVVFTVENPEVTVSVTVKDATSFANIQSARVYLIADTGGPLSAGTIILSGETDSNGLLSTSTFNFTGNQPVVGRVRRATSGTYYKTAPLSGTITSSGLALTAFMIQDQ